MLADSRRSSGEEHRDVRCVRAVHLARRRLAHLLLAKPFLDGRFSTYEYRGVDLVPEFVEAVAAKYPTVSVRQVQSYLDVVEPVDDVVVSGTFNIIEGDDRAAMSLPLAYYGSADRGAVPSWTNAMAELSWLSWLTFDGLTGAVHRRCS